MSTDNKKTFKIFYGESDIRRFTLSPVSWENFLKQLTVPASQKLVYVDEDGDRCTLSTEREFLGMLEHFAKESVIKIYFSGENNNISNKSVPFSSPPTPLSTPPSSPISAPPVTPIIPPSSPSSPPPSAAPEGAGVGKYRIVVPGFVGLTQNVPTCVSPYVCVTKIGTETNIDLDYTALIQEVQTCAAKTPQELRKAKDYINSLLEPSNLENMTTKLRGQAESVGAALESFMAELARQFEENKRQIILQKIQAQQKQNEIKKEVEIKKEEAGEKKPEDSLVEVSKVELLSESKDDSKLDEPMKKLRFVEVEKPYQFAAQLKELSLMGFPEARARETLNAFNGDVEIAIDELLNSDFHHL